MWLRIGSADSASSCFEVITITNLLDVRKVTLTLGASGLEGVPSTRSIWATIGAFSFSRPRVCDVENTPEIGAFEFETHTSGDSMNCAE